jgi:hypothetical protein
MGIADDAPDFPRRRDPDDTVLPVVMLKVEERLREDRHVFRNELASIAAKQEVAQAQASREHAEVRADIARLQNSVAPIPRLADKVAELDRHDIAGQASESARDAILTKLDANRRWMVGTALALAGLIVGAATVFLSHS